MIITVKRHAKLCGCKREENDGLTMMAADPRFQVLNKWIKNLKLFKNLISLFSRPLVYRFVEQHSTIDW
jgi:hypothetical protein